MALALLQQMPLRQIVMEDWHLSEALQVTEGEQFVVELQKFTLRLRRACRRKLSRLQPFALTHEAAVTSCLDHAQAIAARTLLEDSGKHGKWNKQLDRTLVDVEEPTLTKDLQALALTLRARRLGCNGSTSWLVQGPRRKLNECMLLMLSGLQRSRGKLPLVRTGAAILRK